MSQQLAEQLAQRVMRKDFEGLRELFHPEIDYMGMTPGQFWEGSDPNDVIDIYRDWFEEMDEIVSVEFIQTDVVADRERVGYRFIAKNANGNYLVEQQAYLTELDGKIKWLRVMCTGMRPIPE